MSSVGKKVDSSIRSKYRDYLRAQEGSRREAVDDRLHVLLYFTGSLAEIEALGFETYWSDEPAGQASGTLYFAHLERIADHARVEQISYGSEPEPDLDLSIPDIRADEVWSVAGTEFVGDATGAGVVIGIIDSGIDWRHEFFFGRILRIWDPGLVPAEGEEEKPPELKYLSGKAGRYGVVYDRPRIMAAVGGTGEVRHRDFTGHGTHVASIAAGDGGAKRKYIGVAPEAELIVVKFQHLQEAPRIDNVRTGPKVGPAARFQDAVTFILETVRQDLGNRPVVINCSFSTAIGPHDGLTLDEDFLTHRFAGKTGICLVNSAGNSAGKNQHVLLRLTAGAAVEIAIELYDERTIRTVYDQGNAQNLTDDLRIRIYYDPGPDPIEVEVDLPEDGEDFLAGPVRGSDSEKRFGNDEFLAEIDHDLKPQVLTHTRRGTVRRSVFQIKLKVHKTRKEHLLDTYKIRVTSPIDRDAHLWVEQHRKYGLKITTDPSRAVDTSDAFQIGDNAGAENILTVAAYNAEDAEGADTIVDSSSRGPLAQHDPSFPPPPDKPDLAAPGAKIDAAHSREVKPKRWCTDTVQKRGTSMAAPHVAGVVALMLEKNNALTTAQIITKLKTDGVRPVPATEKNKLGTGRLDARKAVDAATAP